MKSINKFIKATLVLLLLFSIVPTSVHARNHYNHYHYIDGYYDSDGIWHSNYNHREYWENGYYIDKFRNESLPYQGYREYYVTPTFLDIDVDGYRVKGKILNYSKGSVYVYYDGIFVGKDLTDEEGMFSIYTSSRVNNDYLLKIAVDDSYREPIKISNFPDKIVPAEKKEYVRIAYIKGFNGEFRPNHGVTRAEAAAMLARLINGSDSFPAGSNNFTDVSDEWFAPAINFIVSKRLISGYSDGTFRPYENITRGEFAKMISEFMDVGNSSYSNIVDIKDHWAKEAIEELYGNKTIKGFPDGTFRPEESLTRAEAVTILNSTFNRVSTEHSISLAHNLGKLISFSDVMPGSWYYVNVTDAANGHKSVTITEADSGEIWTSLLN